MKTKTIQFYFYVLFLSFAFSQYANAIIVKSLSLDVMIEKSKSIFIADIVDVSKLKKDANGLEYNLIKLKIVKSFKDSTENQLIEFKQVSQNQSQKWKHLELLPIPSYKVGQRVLFFMSKKSSKGYQMPIGFNQGKLLVKEKPAKNMDDFTILLNEDHKNIFKLKPNSVDANIQLKTQKIEMNRKSFSVKDFEDLYKDIHP